MKKFISEYLRIIVYTTLGLMLIISGFYLLMNYYHSEEVKTTLYISENEINVQNYKSKLEDIQSNLNKFKNNKNNNTSYAKLYNKLVSCSSVLKAEGTLSTIETNKYYSSYDIYQLGTNLQSNLLNVCWALQISYITSEEAEEEVKILAPYVKNSIDLITNQTSFALEEIQNNSSYFYTTSVTASTIRNYLSSDYKLIANSYNQFADIILSLSKQINEGGKENA